MKIAKGMSAVLISSTSVFAAGAAQAAEPVAERGAAFPASAEPAAETDEIIVTAQKRAERLSDVPMSITAASGEQLDKRGVSDVADLAKIAPGLTFQPSDYGSPVFTIRGIGFKDISVAVAPAVSVYVDQVPLPYSSMTPGAALDLERVEILKGPQGTLFGQNSTGGAINFIAAKPTSSFEVGIEGSYGRFNQLDGQAFVSGPISPGINARLAVRTEQRGAWQRSATRDDGLGSRNFLAGRFLIDAEPTNTLRLEFNINGWRDKSDSQAAQFVRFAPAVANGYQDLVPALTAYAPAPRNARMADWDPGTNLQRDDRFFQGSVRGDLDISDLVTLTSITAYSDLRQYAPIDPDGVNVNDFLLTIRANIRSFSQELRLSGKTLDGGIRWMVGGNFQDDSSRDNQTGHYVGTSSGIGPLRFVEFINSNRQKVRTYAGFGSVDVALTDRLGVQASVRYTTSTNNFSGCLYDTGDGLLASAFSLIAAAPISEGSCVTIDPTTFTAVPVVNKSLREDNLSWRLGATYKPGSNQLLYANVTKGYKAGSFPTVPAFVPDQFNPVEQESVLAYEAGIKQSLLDRKVQLSGSAFYYDYRGKQLIGYIDGAFGQVPALISIPKSDVLGVEIDGVFKPVDGLTITANGIYLRTRVRGDFLANDPFANSVNLGGEEFPNSPKWQYSIDGEYMVPLTADSEAYVGASYAYRSDSVASFGSSPDFRVPAYGLLDLRAGITKGRWRAQIWGHNVTNKFYLQSVTHVIDTVARLTGMPATYGVTIGYKF